MINEIICSDMRPDATNCRKPIIGIFQSGISSRFLELRQIVEILETRDCCEICRDHMEGL